MAIIYSYPYVSTVNNSDTLVISVSDTTADNGFLTKSLTADNLASYVTARVNLNFLGDTGAGVVNLDTQNLSITGTANEIETAASSQILQIGLPDSVTITNDLTVGNEFQAARGVFTGDLIVGTDLTVVGETQTDRLQVDNNATVFGSLSVLNTLTVSDNQGNGSTIDSLLSMDANRITNLSNPIDAQDAATKQYVDSLVSAGLRFKGSFRADSGLILSGTNSGSYLYNCPGGAGARVAIDTGDYYVVANAGGQFYCSGDLLNVGDSIIAVADAAADSSTVNDWATLESDNIEGTGLANNIPLWTDSQVLGNSMLSQDAGATKVTISGALDVSSSLINNVLDPVAAQDAATKAYVDSLTPPANNVSGNGVVGYPAIFDGTNSISAITAADAFQFNGYVPGVITNFVNLGNQGPGNVPTGINWKFYDGGGNPQGDGSINQQGTMTIGETAFGNGGRLIINQSGFTGTTNHRLNVGGNARLEGRVDITAGGLCVSNNPSGIQLDNTSMVIGAGNNDIVNGSDHCLAVGSGNQILSNSDQSVAFGQGNTITDSRDSLAVGNSNTVTSAQRVYALGYNNSVDSASSFVAGGNNNVAGGNTNILIGFDNQATSNNNFVIGNRLNGRTDQQGAAGNSMFLGFRNDLTQFPTTDFNAGLGYTKFGISVGSDSNTNSNALLITEGGVNRGVQQTPQIPRVILPTVPTFSASNDAAADAIGVPEGALYQNNGIVQINRGGASAVDPLSSFVLNSGDTMTGTLVVPNLRIGADLPENELDDYEEGTYTPSITATGTDTTGFSAIGYYTKIGDIVHVEIRISKFVDEDESCNVTNVTLPFTANNTSVINYKGGMWHSETFDQSNLFVLLREGTINLTPYNGFTPNLSLSADESNTIGINITYKTS